MACPDDRRQRCIRLVAPVAVTAPPAAPARRAYSDTGLRSPEALTGRPSSSWTAGAASSQPSPPSSPSSANRTRASSAFSCAGGTKLSMMTVFSFSSLKGKGRAHINCKIEDYRVYSIRY